ncbi:FkbM family methyltransferase [Roseomonas sp. HJA6]|uniref:FkbM family methyltransferase n=1 Tax=Roseomonas alba TaxID=2846776 RepID=A0ABS7A8E0_9PROT|nr:FkbM family methyltransferase [Neoroseomonas alba]MBW6398581.1 FkbM family methyltransferase [Neoroseomonas alba]
MDALSPDPIAARLAALEQRLAGMERVLREIRQLVGPFAVPMGPDALLVQTIHGVKYMVPTHDMVMTPQLVVYRQWEAQLSALLPRLCPQGGVFVDVGANFGYFTCLLAARMGRSGGGRIIAIEPNPELLDLLRTNIGINWSGAPVRVEPVAVAETPGEMMLTIPDGRFANGTLAPLEAEGRELRAHRVSVTRLDDLLRQEPRIDLIKIDVEGFEPAVLRGGAETLARDGLKLVLEWSVPQLREAGFDPMETPRLLEAAGYRLFDAEAGTDPASGKPLTAADFTARSYCNLLAVR